jgi:PERQ amino acid-rich with GYF domain-containing protein
MGAFGSFAIGSGTGQASTPTEKRSGFGSIRGESRFKGLMAKEGVEDTGRNVKEKGSLGSLGRLNESDQDRGVASWMEARSQRPTSEDSDPFPDEELRAGSAALGGGYDHNPAQQRGFGSSALHDPRDEAIFSRLGMTTDNVGSRGGNGEDLSHQTPQHRNEGLLEPMSPTDTNPFQSPENDRNGSEDQDTDDSEVPNSHLPGLGGFNPNQGGLHGLGGFGLGRVSAPYENAASDRSQTSSVGPGRGLTSLSGLGGLPGLGGASPWSAAPGSGTPTRERSGFGGAFGEGIFGSVADLQSPVTGLAGLGGNNAFGAAPGSGIGGMGTIGRGSRMGSLFPAAMQEEMRNEDQGRLGNEEGPFDPFQRQQPGFGATFGRAPFGSNAMGPSIPARETESPFRSGRGVFDDLIGGTSREQDISSPFGDTVSSPFGVSNPISSVQQNLSSFPSQEAIGGQRSSQPVLQRQPSGILSPGGGQPPVSQIRTMVMPDRMKWIYRDPQNEIQGPWSGLEMHDWYKSGFFTPELLIKRLEDPDFEPLAQLIRRIGNSREPFLVPQIGVPHEPSSNPSRALQPPVTGTSNAQPPFASSFPSFGTTLTAEQQNALERRKQEEQYLMARQKEHLAQQQLLIKQMQIQGGGHGILPSQLHHHSSAHSLHSQPSFGSITSPSGYQPSPTQGPITGGQPVPGFFDNSFRPAPGANMVPMGGDLKMLGNIREDEIPGMLERLNVGRGSQQPIGGGQAPFGQGQPMDPHPQQVAAMLNDRARLQREQAEHDLQQRLNHGDMDAQMASDRLHQFHDLRLQTDMEHEQQQIGSSSRDEYNSSEQANAAEMDAQLLSQIRKEMQAGSDEAREQAPSLTQQVQAAASAKQASAQQMAWTKVDITTMEPMQRPPQSISPMPAPVAQRKQNVADNLVAESRSRTQSPSVDTPGATLAPWAKESVEATKGPSLKEIQEAEAKKAARQEEIVAAQRRAALEKEYALAQAATLVAPAPGLPSTSNWASAQSPAGSNSSAPSVWAKPSSKNTGSKTLQQIQKEEEDRKRRAVAAAAAAAGAVTGLGPSTQPLSSGKRYADITSKATPASPGPLGNSPWTTVGAGGKVKALPVASPPAVAGTVRSVSGGVPTTQTPKPSTTRSTTMGATQMAKVGKTDAQDEFKKWAIAELVRGQLNVEVKRELKSRSIQG